MVKNSHIRIWAGKVIGPVQGVYPTGHATFVPELEEGFKIFNGKVRGRLRAEVENFGPCGPKRKGRKALGNR